MKIRADKDGIQRILSNMGEFEVPKPVAPAITGVKNEAK